ncbi:DUF4168 domain-containing protein [uncultured Marixanthomonas sp.]|uniref:DUF4168 domain-containing protein n=1 Tax=uncultured Marixanthomonas sp. TaxID=757245 RepID=UPI0030D6CE8E
MSRFKATTLVLFVTLLGGLSFAQAQDTMQPQPQSKVTDAELGKFAKAFQVVQMENQKAQQKMATVISDNGMEVERFSTIQQATANPNQDVDATDAEMKKHGAIMAEIKKMQPAIEAKMEKAVADSGITIERYQAIGTALQQDKSLQQRFQKMMMANTTQKQ